MPEKIGKYDVVERIGRGGMGMVFKAHDPVLDRLVAIKVISPEVEVTDELRTRFFREAQACARLNHPNIVTVYDMGEDAGRLFIVMELLEGDELRRLIAEPVDMSLEDKLSLMLQVCSGLHYAHQRDIVHRDMKPANVLLLRNGQVKIVDFGIAHVGSTETGLTRTGLIMGTLRYIAPEQVRGRADHRSDMFSLGSVFYELLTSRPPFVADDPMELLEQLRTQDPPAPIEIDPRLPSRLSEIVQRAMRKDPDERFRDLEEMRAEIESVHRAVLEAKLARAEADGRRLEERRALDGDRRRRNATTMEHPAPASAGAPGRDDEMSAPPGPPAPAPGGRRRLRMRGALAVAVGSWRFRVGASVAVTVGGIALVVLSWRGGTPPVYPPPVSPVETPTPHAPPPPPEPAPVIEQPKAVETVVPKAEPPPRVSAPEKPRIQKPPVPTAPPPQAVDTGAAGRAAEEAAAARRAAEEAAAASRAAEEARALSAARATAEQAERAAAQKAAADKALADRLAAEKAAADKAAADKAAAERAAAEKAAVEARAAAAPAPSESLGRFAPDPSSAIRRVLDDLKRAYESRDLAEIQRIRPGLSTTDLQTLRTTFDGASRYSIDFRLETVEVRGDEARARAFRQDVMFARNGEIHRSEGRVTIRFKRVQDRWTIEDIR